MKKIIYSLLGVVLISGVIYSCKKENVTSDPQKSILIPENTINSKFEQIDGFSPSQIGQMHNDALEYVGSRLQYSEDINEMISQEKLFFEFPTYFA